MKIKTTSKQSGIGILGWVLVIVGLFIIINGVPLLIWYLRPITGTPLPLPQRGFIPLDVNGQIPARCECGNEVGGICEAP